jgi:chemotaxis protein methyltransferase CheR
MPTMPECTTHLTDLDSLKYQELIAARTGLVFEAHHRESLTRSILQAARDFGMNEPKAYLDVLRLKSTNSPAWHALLNLITVGETYFFRDAAQMEALRATILPMLISAHRQDKRLRIWSAGCATGEEPYSLAMLLLQLLPDISQWKILILGTDINLQALRQCESARYRPWSFRQSETRLYERFFIDRGEMREVHPDVRRLVTFTTLNLVEDVYPAHASRTNNMDLILFRNVSLYFPESTNQRIIDRFYNCLVPEGWLVVGASETNNLMYRSFSVSNFPGATVYRKSPIAQPALPSHSWQAPQLKSVLPAAPVPPSALEPPRQHRPGQPPCPDPDDPYQAGLAHLADKRLDAAETCFRACASARPGFAPALYQVAKILANRGALEEAQDWCEQTLARDPLLVEAHYTLALIQVEKGWIEQAVRQLQKVIYLDPNFILAHFSLSHLQLKLHHPTEALRHRAHAARLAVKIAPETILPGSDDLTAVQLTQMIQSTH